MTVDAVRIDQTPSNNHFRFQIILNIESGEVDNEPCILSEDPESFIGNILPFGNSTRWTKPSFGSLCSSCEQSLSRFEEKIADASDFILKDSHSEGTPRSYGGSSKFGWIPRFASWVRKMANAGYLF
jgi:hypothetical protein